MSTSPRYVQSKPVSEAKEEVVEWAPLLETDLGADADELLCYFARYPVERNHPRAPVPHPGIKRSGEVVVCNEDDPLPKVFGELITQGFLASPVTTRGGKYKHFVDMHDIVKGVLSAFGVYRTELGRREDEVSREADYASFVKLDRFTKNTVKDLLQQFKKDHVAPPGVHRGYSLLHPMEIMARENARRVPIVDPEDVVKGIITNSMVISLLDQNLHRLGSIRHKKVTTIMGGLTDVVWSCKTTDLAIDAFKKMSDKGVMGLAVVDQRGVLVDNLSIRDLRIIGERMQHFLRLYLSVTTFKQLCKEEFSKQTPSKPIFVHRSDTVEDVIRAMDDGNIHRVYVCNLTNERDPMPVHVITQRDMIRYLLWQCGLAPTTIEDLKRGAPAF